MFGGGYVDQAPIYYDAEHQKATFGSAADWTNEAALQRPNNGAGAQDPYMMQQAQLSSTQIPLEITDNTCYMPLAKNFKKRVDEITTKITDTPTPRNRKVDDEFKGWLRVQEPVNQEYDAGKRAKEVIWGKYQQTYEPRVETPATPKKAEFNVEGHETQHVT